MKEITLTIGIVGTYEKTYTAERLKQFKPELDLEDEDAVVEAATELSGKDTYPKLVEDIKLQGDCMQVVGYDIE